MQIAKVIIQDNRQLVQLPEGFSLPCEEVYVKRLGKSVLLIPKDADLWNLMAENLDQFTKDFMEVRCQPAQQQGGDLTP